MNQTNSYPVSKELSYIAGSLYVTRVNVEQKLIPVSRCIIMAVTGALGNLLTILAIPWAQKNKKLGFDKYPLKFMTPVLLNLAFADFMYCVVNLPLCGVTVSKLGCQVSHPTLISELMQKYLF